MARTITQVNGTDKIPGVQEKLGELAALVSSVESALIAAETRLWRTLSALRRF